MIIRINQDSAQQTAVLVTTANLTQLHVTHSMHNMHVSYITITNSYNYYKTILQYCPENLI